MYSNIIPSVCKAYGLDVSKIFSAQKGYRNESYPVELRDGKKVNVLFFKREPQILKRIDRADTVSEYLAQSDLPARKRYDRRVLRVKTSSSSTYVQVYDYLPGETIPWEAYTKSHIKLLGKVMSDMHSILRSAKCSDMPTISEEYTDLADRMYRYFKDHGVKNAMNGKLHLSIDADTIVQSKAILTRAQSVLYEQPLHMDFVRGNVLFDSIDGKLVVSGIIDFEKTALGHPIVDIARTLAFLFVDCKYTQPEKVYKYFLYSGYTKLGQSNYERVSVRVKGQPYDLLDQLVIFFLTHDFYKFLKHNPYEQLMHNEHFVRTRNMLVRYNMINYTYT